MAIVGPMVADFLFFSVFSSFLFLFFLTRQARAMRSLLLWMVLWCALALSWNQIVTSI